MAELGKGQAEMQVASNEDVVEVGVTWSPDIDTKLEDGRGFISFQLPREKFTAMMEKAGIKVEFTAGE